MGKPLAGGFFSSLGTAAVQNLARVLVEQGWTIYGVINNKKLATELDAIGLKVAELDVTDDDAVMSYATALLKREGRIDHVFYASSHHSFLRSNCMMERMVNFNLK